MKRATLTPIRQLAKWQSDTRAVGAMVISPAFQRGVSAHNIQPESRRDGAKSAQDGNLNEINHLQPL